MRGQGTLAAWAPATALGSVSALLATTLAAATHGRERHVALLAAAAALLTTVASGATRVRVAGLVRRLDAAVASAGEAPEPSDDGPLDHLARSIGSLADEMGAARWSRSVVEGSADLTVVVDAAGVVVRASAAATTMLGRPTAWLAGTPLAALAHPEDRGRLDDLRCRPIEDGRTSCEEVRFSHLHGHWVPTDVTVLDVALPEGDGDRGGAARVLNVRDVSVRKAHDESLLRQALYDPLTGLPNRTLFQEHVDKALARLRRTPARPHAVLFVDLDGFKMVNDSLGHAAGDEVLAEVGTRLARWVRPGDTAARLGGDEFAVLLENTSELDTGLLARRILDVLDMPIDVQGREVVLSASIGIALSEPGVDSDSLLRDADAAMYTAKAAGKGQYRFFEQEMHRAAVRRLDLEADLRRAVGRRQLVLRYQPVVTLATGEVTAAEVLVRWRHPERGMIQPRDFISVAEDSGLIRPMGRAILEEACAQVRTWHLRRPDQEPLRLCVNASVRQLQHADYVAEVAGILRATGLEGTYLTLEITESLFMTDLDASVQTLRRLKDLGVTLAVDDFGTGYSSLSYLRSLPIDVLKIDKSFVHGVTLGPEQSAVARAVVRLARTFNLRTVAEGIERADQADALLALGADMGQGFWYARPLTVPDLEAHLDRRRVPGAGAPAPTQAPEPATAGRLRVLPGS